MTVLRLELPASPGEVLLWSHLCLLWILVNYAHRLDPLARTEARDLGSSAVRTWRWGVVLRALAGALVASTVAGFRGSGLVLGGLFLAGASVLPLARLRWMRAGTARWGRDLRAEGELAVNAFVLAGAAFLVGAGHTELRAEIVTLPFSPASVAGALLVAAGALFLLRGGTHVVRGVLEKTDTLPKDSISPAGDDLRHGVTIGNIERLLIYLFALAGSHAAIGLVLAAKGVVRAVEWEDRTLVEYFLIGTLASAGLAAALGMAVRWLLAGL